MESQKQQISNNNNFNNRIQQLLLKTRILIKINNNIIRIITDNITTTIMELMGRPRIQMRPHNITNTIKVNQEQPQEGSSLLHQEMKTENNSSKFNLKVKNHNNSRINNYLANEIKGKEGNCLMNLLT
jgi:hypothetical protein